MNPGSPSRVLRRHFQRLSADVDGAFSIMSSRFRAANPGWPSERSEAQPYVNVVEIGQSDVGSEFAYVPIVFYARDSYDTSVSDRVCRKFQGNARLRKEGSHWLYDPAKGQFDVEEFRPPLQKCIR